MKAAKTILAVALLIVGFSYVSYAYPPTLGTVDQCCGPQPEDLRVYRVAFTSSEPITIIPKVEGPNGFMITHVRISASVRLFQDVGEGPEEILDVGGSNRLNPTMQFPLVTGSTITALDAVGQNATIIGYVY